jgi:hypothetical protein
LLKKQRILKKNNITEKIKLIFCKIIQNIIESLVCSQRERERERAIQDNSISFLDMPGIFEKGWGLKKTESDPYHFLSPDRD